MASACSSRSRSPRERRSIDWSRTYGRFSLALSAQSGLLTDVVRTLYGDSTGALSTITVADGLPADDVWTLCEDRAYELRIGTANGGLDRLRDGRGGARPAARGLSLMGRAKAIGHRGAFAAALTKPVKPAQLYDVMLRAFGEADASAARPAGKPTTSSSWTYRCR